MSLGDFWGMLKETFREYGEDRVARLSAALAYYTVFALPPLLVITIALAGLFFDPSQIQAQIESTVISITGSQAAANVISSIMQGAATGTGVGFGSIIGIAGLLFAASGVFVQLQDALNTIWEVKERPGVGLMGVIKGRFFAFLLVIGVGILLMAFLIVSSIIPAFGQLITGVSLPGSNILWWFINLFVSLAVFTLLFAAIFKVIPQANIRWQDVWVGAFATALLFVIGQVLMGIYLGMRSFTDIYGAVGALVILLFWIYVAAQILFIGAEFTQVYARARGKRIMPEKGAVRMTVEDRMEQGIPHERTIRQEEKRAQEGRYGEGREREERPAQERPAIEPGSRQGQWAKRLPPNALYMARHPQPETRTPIVVFSAVVATLIGFLSGLIFKRT